MAKKYYVLEGAELRTLLKEHEKNIINSFLNGLRTPINEDRYLSRREACQVLGIGLTALNNRIKDKTIKAVKVGRLVKIKQSDLQEFQKKEVANG